MRVLELYFDESGSRLPDHKPSKPAEVGKDYFRARWVLIEAKDARNSWDRHKEFCKRWSIVYPLHSHDIRNRRKKFGWLRKVSPEERERFLEDLTRLICHLPICVIACVIDRPGYNARYELLYGEKRWLLCKTAFAVMVERAAKFADLWGYRLTIHYEGSGEREDRAIETYLKDLKESGMPFDSGTSGKYTPLMASDFAASFWGIPTERRRRLQSAR